MGKFVDWLLGVDESPINEFASSTTTNRTDEITIEEDNQNRVTIQDAIDFVIELQSYYYNDITKMQSDLVIKTRLPQSTVYFMNKKIKQEQVALDQIDYIIVLLQEIEREFQSVWGKSVYSFYDEIEGNKLSQVQQSVYETLVKLCAINTKPELNSVINNRLKLYRDSWGIVEDVPIPQNFNAILIAEEDGIEEYSFGKFKKFVNPSPFEKTLSTSQLNLIRNLELELEEPITMNEVWVHISNATRLSLNRMRRTCLVGNSWEYCPNLKDKLWFDRVNPDLFEQFIKGVLQIVLARNTYAIISIFVPTQEMLSLVGETYQIGDKIVVERKWSFILRERSGLYRNNLLTARVDRRNIQEKLLFVSYTAFRKNYFY